MSRKEDDGNVRPYLQELFGKIEAGELGHGLVGDDEVKPEWIGSEELEHPGAVGQGYHGIAKAKGHQVTAS